jgi:hypothetical protein
MVRHSKHFKVHRRDAIDDVVGKPRDHQPPRAVAGFPYLRELKQAVQNRPHGVTKSGAKSGACRFIVQR